MPAKKKNRFEYFYTIDPSNFHSLPEDRQKQRIGEFLDLLRSIEKPIRITFSRKSVPLMVGGRTEMRLVLQVLVASNEPLTGMLDTLMYEYTVDDEHARITFERERLGHMQ